MQFIAIQFCEMRQFVVTTNLRFVGYAVKIGFLLHEVLLQRKGGFVVTTNPPFISRPSIMLLVVQFQGFLDNFRCPLVILRTEGASCHIHNFLLHPVEPAKKNFAFYG